MNQKWVNKKLLAENREEAQRGCSKISLSNT